MKPYATSDDDILPHELLVALARRGHLATFPAGAVLFREGEVGGSIYIVFTGRIRVYASSGSARAKDIVFAELGPGHYVGELSIDGGRRSASVKTVEPTTCCVVQRAGISDFFAEHPEFAIHLRHKLIRMVRRLTEQVKSLGLQDARGRVARLLMELSEEIPDQPGQRMMREALTHQEIADRIGASREMVRHALRALMEAKRVGVDPKTKRLRILQVLPRHW